MGAFAALRKLVAPRRGTLLAFRCNVCGSGNSRPLDSLTREDSSCSGCGSSVRMRSIVHHVSLAVYGSSLALPDFPKRPATTGIGMSDWGPYATGFSQAFDYTNTYYHQEPFLDITDVPDAKASRCDFVVSTDVFEHVAPPVSRAFDGAFKLLKPGGTFVLTVPFMTEESETREHFPHLHKFDIREAGGKHRLFNERASGDKEEFGDLIFHGGPGTTLEMRLFAKDALPRELARAGFVDIHYRGEDYLPFGIHWKHPWSVPITARRPS